MATQKTNYGFKGLVALKFGQGPLWIISGYNWLLIDL